MDADGLLAALDLPDIDGMEIGLLSQLLLGEADAFAILADRLANNPALSWRCWHALQDNQQGGWRNTAYSPLFFAIFSCISQDGLSMWHEQDAVISEVPKKLLGIHQVSVFESRAKAALLWKWVAGMEQGIAVKRLRWFCLPVRRRVGAGAIQ